MNYAEVIAEESAAFLRAVNGNLPARVPSCPEWTVGDLTAHLGGVQRFHALHLVRGVTDPPTEHTDVPEDDDALLLWFEEGTKLLLAALDRPLDGPAWNWAPHTPQTVAFWRRRMALEAAVHRWDAESARHDAQGFVAGLAEDGIDEVLTVHHETMPGNVLVRLTDSERTWGNEKTPDAVLEGTASGVFLALWGRVPLSSLTTEGDESQVAALRTG
ncbi:MAG: hypothetical protein JWO27_1407 [Frankiales bacterium]|nr:hypothetical protein [Frankiales bacterium]